MKQCNKCGIAKPYVEFSKDKTRTDGYCPRCKECRKLCHKPKPYDYEKWSQWYSNNKEKHTQRTRKWQIEHSEHVKQYAKQKQQSLTLPYWVVYLLPDYNYVGITKSPYRRMAVHRNQFNRNTSNWIELDRFDTETEALAKEAEYHAQGYAGIDKRKSRHRNDRT